eukprot:scaffold118707_cov63-Phaeocystis_antarctica.AAC.3
MRMMCSPCFSSGAKNSSASWAWCSTTEPHAKSWRKRLAYPKPGRESKNLYEHAAVGDSKGSAGSRALVRFSFRVRVPFCESVYPPPCRGGLHPAREEGARATRRKRRAPRGRAELLGQLTPGRRLAGAASKSELGKRQAASVVRTSPARVCEQGRGPCVYGAGRAAASAPIYLFRRRVIVSRCVDKLRVRNRRTTLTQRRKDQHQHTPTLAPVRVHVYGLDIDAAIDHLRSPRACDLILGEVACPFLDAVHATPLNAVSLERSEVRIHQRPPVGRLRRR